MWQVETVQADFFCLSCTLLLLELHHRPRQGTKCTSACASCSTQCTPESFLSCAESLALSLKAPHEAQGWFLVFFISQNKCIHWQWKNWAHLCLIACFQIMTASHMPGKSYFCSHMEDWFDKLIWLENTLFPTMPLAHPTTTSSNQLLPFPSPSYPLVSQAVGPGDSKWPWSLLPLVAQPAVPAGGASRELPSRRRDQCLQVADQYLCMAEQSISALFFRAWIKPLNSEGKIPCLCTQQACQDAQGEEKCQSPHRTRKALGQQYSGMYP